MAPKRAGLSDEQKQQAYDKWCTEDEYKAIEAFRTAMYKDAKILGIERGTEDIMEDWSDVLNKWFKMMEALKVPGRKAKSYEQNILRTMFFRRCEVLEIDGKSYVFSNSAMLDHYKCKEIIVGIWDHCKDDFFKELTKDNYQSWRKELLGKLKEWDKAYIKHMRGTNPELSQIHSTAMQPLVNLMESNFNFYNFLRLRETNPELPDFRHKALEEKFIEHMTKVCDILAAFPNVKEVKLEQPYDIAQMLEVLKTKDWKNIPPLRFFMQPLRTALDHLIKVLNDMRKRGVLQCSYYVERNLEMQKSVIEMVSKDVIVQAVAGDDLKRDQFKFLYKIHEIVFNTALKPLYLKQDMTKSGVIRDTVIPMLTVLHAMLRIRDIDDKKAADEATEAEKRERREKYGIPEPEEEEEKMDIPLNETQKKALKRGKKIEYEPEQIAEYKAKKALEKEMATYGRTWVWEGYYAPDNEEVKQRWDKGAVALRSINPQVLEDLQDFIILKGFANEAGYASQEQIGVKIAQDLEQKRERAQMAIQEVTEENDPKLLGKTEDRKRRFLNINRPHDKIWNFIQSTDAENYVEHVLRPDADPRKAYQDGRVEVLMEIVETMAIHLRTFNSEVWEYNNCRIKEIFVAEEASMEEDYKAMKERKEEEANF